MIFNERSQISVPEAYSATIYWETNIGATSQVIYGPSGSSYTIDLDQPYLGYPSGTNEVLSKTVSHSVVLSGLTPGQTYKYRVVSRASPPSVSYEHEFTVPAAGEENTASGSLGNAARDGSIGAVLALATSSEAVGEVAGAFKENNLATVHGLWAQSFWWILLLVLLLIFITWRILNKRKS